MHYTGAVSSKLRTVVVPRCERSRQQPNAQPEVDADQAARNGTTSRRERFLGLKQRLLLSFGFPSSVSEALSILHLQPKRTMRLPGSNA